MVANDLQCNVCKATLNTAVQVTQPPHFLVVLTFVIGCDRCVIGCLIELFHDLLLCGFVVSYSDLLRVLRLDSRPMRPLLYVAGASTAALIALVLYLAFCVPLVQGLRVDDYNVTHPRRVTSSSPALIGTAKIAARLRGCCAKDTALKIVENQHGVQPGSMVGQTLIRRLCGT